MNSRNKITRYAGLFLVMCVAIISCQKMERPPLGNYPKDPPVPPYNPLKSLFAFENNVNDEGENKLKSTSSNITYTAGINGQGIKIGADGYLLLKVIGDTVVDANGYVSVPADTLKTLGSFTLSFWMNGVGPVQGGAQGLFAISHKTQFWGNLELFLENWSNAGDASEGFLKIHMFNAGVSSGNGEEWNELKIPGLLNKWSHIALTYDAATSKLTLYANGVATSINNKSLGGGTYGKIKYNDFNGVVIGTYAFQTTPSLTNHGPESWAKSFDGSLDQFRLYNKALTTAEITALFTGKL